MFNPVTVVCEAFGRHLGATYEHYYSEIEPTYRTVIEAGARLLIERLSTSDALYHDYRHTITVTLVGQDILRGRLLRERLEPDDWLHFITALLCHDAGYVRGILTGDRGDLAVVDADGSTVEVPRGASDAWLAPWHVTRSKLFVRERFAASRQFDSGRLAAMIEGTRFPADPTDRSNPEARLIRAADLIGQLADPMRGRNQTALFHEMRETGLAEELGYQTAADLADGYANFFWTKVEPHLNDALDYLQLTPEGLVWIGQLYSQVFAAEHHREYLGPAMGRRQLRTPRVRAGRRRR